MPICLEIFFWGSISCFLDEVQTCQLSDESSVRIKIKYFNEKQQELIKTCELNLIVETDVRFKIQRNESRHRSKIIYWRLDLKQQDEFNFADVDMNDLNSSVTLWFDGKTLNCTGVKNNGQECNGLSVGKPVPVVLFSLDFNPRNAEFFTFDEHNQWERNKYSAQGSVYKVACKGIV